MLFAGLMGAVALLTDLRPGRDRVAIAAAAEPKGPPPVVQAGESGDLAVALAVRPTGAELVALDPDGRRKDGLSVRIAGVAASSCGPGCYGAAGAFVGKVPVSVDGRTLVFRFPARARPAGALVARATSAFRRLRSVDYVERLASSPQNKVVAEFTLERPNRLEYRIRGGADGIIIGVTALGPRTRRQVGAVASGSDLATRADLGRPLHERVPARDDADDVRRVVPQADRPGVVHAAPRPPHVASAEPAHDRAGALHDASLHEVQRSSQDQSPKCRAMTMRWTSLVPSPISRIFWSR